jgi:hypothetical protein
VRIPDPVNTFILELKRMESNITEQQYSGGLLSEPHFDEEATILSARPVVPLHEIKAAKRSGKRLTFALALVAALIVGALGATLIYRQRGQIAETATIETGIPDTNTDAGDVNAVAAGPIEANAGGGPSDTRAAAVSASAVSASAKVSDVLTSEPRDTAATRPQKPTTLVVQRAGPAKSTETARDEVNNPDEIRAQRRAERLEARRLRREAARESGGEVRSRRVRRADDLWRIREIFEGRRKP